jgi:hypothetical protein
VFSPHSNSSDFSPEEFFLFPKVKEQLAKITQAQNNLKCNWERAIRTITKEEFAAAFRRWSERNKKCVCIGDYYVEKS